MTPSPIRKVLSSLRKHRVRYLLMGGQACVLYGAAEFSRDADLAIVASRENLTRLKRALKELQAECIAVPPFQRRYLDKGLAVHFRCKHPEAFNIRIDIMSKMRGVESFEILWKRRTTFHFLGETIEFLSLPDLVKAKKTQRDKDWPMVERLVESNYFQNRAKPSAEQIQFWLQELRTPSLLMEVISRFPRECEEMLPSRSLLAHGQAHETALLEEELRAEEQGERDADRRYWQPLRRELEALRRAAPKTKN